MSPCTEKCIHFFQPQGCLWVPRGNHLLNCFNSYFTELNHTLWLKELMQFPEVLRISLLVRVKIRTKTTSPLENDMFPDGMLGPGLFAFYSCKMMAQVSCFPQGLLLGSCGQSIKAKQTQRDRSRGLDTSAPGARLVSIPSIPVFSVGIHKLRASSVYDFCLGRNFSGHFHWFRGFQPASASEAPREL